MENQNLNQLIKKIGNKIEKTAGEYLFTVEKKDYGIYLIEEGKVMLEKEGKDIISLGEGEVFGEKSFLEGTTKPLDARVIEYGVFYNIEKDEFENFSESEKEFFLKNFSILLSERVYKLNEILQTLNYFNQKLLQNITSKDEKNLLEAFNFFLEVDKYLVLKDNGECFEKIAANILFNQEVEGFILNNYYDKDYEKIGKNYILIFAGSYIYFLQGKIKQEEYVITNAFMYLKPMLRYLGENIEKRKYESVLNSTEEFDD